MRIEQRTRNGHGWTGPLATLGSRAQLALVFAPTAMLADPRIWEELIELYPGARIAGCSTAGEIAGGRVLDDALVVTAIAFDHSQLAVAQVELDEADGDRERGELLAARLPPEGLVHILALSHGLKVNGSALVAGLTARLPPGVAVTGGLAGDGARFTSAAVCLDGPVPSEQIVAIGLYGDRLRIGYGSLAGWDPFGRVELAILISCVGRKLVLDRRIEDEIGAARAALGDAVTTGFYSYGEIAPFSAAARCELHNPTMTITTLSER